VEVANKAARDSVPDLRIGHVLPVRGGSPGDALLRFLDRCSTTNESLPGALDIQTAEDAYERQPCRGRRVTLEAFGSTPLILLHLHTDRLDKRFKLLALKLHDARHVMQERRRRTRQMQTLLEERERLLQRLEEDAAARRLAEAERDQVLTQLYRAGQAERQRLARDLHDHAGQHLVALNFGLRRLTPYLTDPQAQAELEQLLRQAQDVGQALRRVTLELRPAALDEFGLITALRYLVDEWTRVTAIPTEFQVVGEECCFPTELTITLYRTAQEALTNVAKHAQGASCVSIVVRFSLEQITLAIDDNGSGFDADSSSTGFLVGQGKLGLIGMRERLTLVGGNLEIESSPGRGASLVARVRLTTEGGIHA
jgi:signal transduction histidine kinase